MSAATSEPAWAPRVLDTTDRRQLLMMLDTALEDPAEHIAAAHWFAATHDHEIGDDVGLYYAYAARLLWVQAFWKRRYEELERTAVDVMPRPVAERPQRDRAKQRQRRQARKRNRGKR